MWQNYAVNVVVVVAVGYALWYLMPAALRRHLAVIRPGLGKAPSCASSCSDCGGCGPKAGHSPGTAEKSVTITRR